MNKEEMKQVQEYKEKQMSICRKHLKYAEEIELSDESPTVVYWTRILNEWKETNIYQCQEYYLKMKKKGAIR